MTMRFVSVAQAASIEPGTGRSVEVCGLRIAVYNFQGEMFALEDSCSHRGAFLGAGFLEEDSVMCPMHGWAFHVKTGACLTNPSRPVRVYPVKVEGGEVFVGLGDSEESQDRPQ